MDPERILKLVVQRPKIAQLGDGRLQSSYLKLMVLDEVQATVLESCLVDLSGKLLDVGESRVIARVEDMRDIGGHAACGMRDIHGPRFSSSRGRFVFFPPWVVLRCFFPPGVVLGCFFRPGVVLVCFFSWGRFGVVLFVLGWFWHLEQVNRQDP